MIKIALIPSYEPEEKLINLTEELKENNFEIIIVDDGSGKKYNNIFAKCSKVAKIISYEKNRGKGYALKKGFKYIKGKYKDYIVVTMDCDGQHRVKDALKLVNYIEKNNDSLVLGKRLRDKKIPVKSKLGNALTRLIFSFATKISIYDTQTGLRAFSSNLMDYMLSIKGDRYEYEMNVLLNAHKNNIRMEEIEIETIYIENNKGSHFNAIKDSYKIYKEIIKFSLSSIISFIIDYILYILFVLLFNDIVLSNVLARIASASANYTMNNNYVFKSNESKKKSLIKYIMLAISILTLNTFILKGLTILGMNKFVAKLLTELTLFILSWIVQKKFIFK